MQVAMIAAGFTPGEADSLRRSMAAWRRKGGISHFHEKLTQGMLANGYDEAFAEAIFRQMEGFGEYGFPESHAASFALLAYASAWLKCHYPQAFLAALLNSQPMGFYRPAQLVQEAARNGVRTLPVDVCHSAWEAGIEALRPDAAPADAALAPDQRWADLLPSDPRLVSVLGVRLGLNQVKGLADETAQRIEFERRKQPFASLDDLTRRVRPSRHELEALAAANALRSLAGHRREAVWAAARTEPTHDLLAQTEPAETAPKLAVPSEAQEILADYRSLGLTLQRHPLALLREQLQGMRYRTARSLHRHTSAGRRVRACGIVVGRQRPGTAKGTVFVTLEDETGPVNVIIWPSLVEAQRRELLGAYLLGVEGEWQRANGVCNLVAHRLVDLSALLGSLRPKSRDFH